VKYGECLRTGAERAAGKVAWASEQLAARWLVPRNAQQRPQFMLELSRSDVVFVAPEDDARDLKRVC
jgi:hypothetical protein